MKKLLNIIALSLVLASCASDEVRHSEKVVRRHDTNNSPWIVYYYDIVGRDSTWVGEKWFHDNGVLNLEGPIVDGKREGLFKGYYPSGKLMSTGNFKNGLREGRGVVYHENGNISIDGNYKNGAMTGIWKFYDEDGNVINVMEY